MNVEDWVAEHTIFECLVGSRAYGLSTPSSDYDYRGFCIPPVEYFFGPVGFDQKDKAWADGADRTIWNLSKGVGLLLNGNPSLTELLFAPSHLGVKTSCYWDTILDTRHAFLSKRAKSSYLGYADKQAHLMKSTFGEDVYNTKPAAHLLRVLYQGIDLLKYGEFDLELTGQERSMCLEVKAGDVPLSAVTAEANKLIAELKAAAERSDLPDEPDRVKAYEVLHELLKDFYRIER